MGENKLITFMGADWSTQQMNKLAIRNTLWPCGRFIQAEGVIIFSILTVSSYQSYLFLKERHWKTAFLVQKVESNPVSK